jgi:chromosome segregation protein
MRMTKDVTDLEELRKEFREKKKEVASQRLKLNSINSEKEETYRELRSIRDKTKFRTQKINSLKKERDAFTKQVKALKEKREKLNKAVREKAKSKKEGDQKKQDFLDKHDFKGNPARLKTEAEQLEMKIETEVMAFSKEQELRKRIKELKAKFKAVEKQSIVWKEINSTSSDFRETKIKAEESHQKIQELAKQSQEKHEEINVLYAEMKKVREEEQPLAEKYLKLKVEYEQVKKDLEELLARVKVLSKVFNEEEEKSYKTQVREKTAEVREKMNKRQKLSTEDILAFQAIKD